MVQIPTYVGGSTATRRRIVSRQQKNGSSRLLLAVASLPGAEGFSHPSVVSSTLISSKLIAPIGWSLFWVDYRRAGNESSRRQSAFRRARTRRARTAGSKRSSLIERRSRNHQRRPPACVFIVAIGPYSFYFAVGVSDVGCLGHCIFSPHYSRQRVVVPSAAAVRRRHPLRGQLSPRNRRNQSRSQPKESGGRSALGN